MVDGSETKQVLMKLDWWKVGVIVAAVAVLIVFGIPGFVLAAGMVGAYVWWMRREASRKEEAERARRAQEEQEAILRVVDK